MLNSTLFLVINYSNNVLTRFTTVLKSRVACNTKTEWFYRIRSSVLTPVPGKRYSHLALGCDVTQHALSGDIAIRTKLNPDYLFCKEETKTSFCAPYWVYVYVTRHGNENRADVRSLIQRIIGNGFGCGKCFQSVLLWEILNNHNNYAASTWVRECTSNVFANWDNYLHIIALVVHAMFNYE